jgi:hypothetical protein
MKYCRFLLDGQPHYGKVEDRNSQHWITDLDHAPEDDLAFHLAIAAQPRPRSTLRRWPLSHCLSPMPPCCRL